MGSSSREMVWRERDGVDPNTDPSRRRERDPLGRTHTPSSATDSNSPQSHAGLAPALPRSVQLAALEPLSSLPPDELQTPAVRPLQGPHLTPRCPTRPSNGKAGVLECGREEQVGRLGCCCQGGCGEGRRRAGQGGGQGRVRRDCAQCRVRQSVSPILFLWGVQESWLMTGFDL